MFYHIQPKRLDSFEKQETVSKIIDGYKVIVNYRIIYQDCEVLLYFPEDKESKIKWFKSQKIKPDCEHDIIDYINLEETLDLDKLNLCFKIGKIGKIIYSKYKIHGKVSDINYDKIINCLDKKGIDYLQDKGWNIEYDNYLIKNGVKVLDIYDDEKN